MTICTEGRREGFILVAGQYLMVAITNIDKLDLRPHVIDQSRTNGYETAVWRPGNITESPQTIAIFQQQPVTITLEIQQPQLTIIIRVQQIAAIR